VSWNGSNQYKSDPNAFIFSLTNQDNRPCKMITTKPSQSIYCQPGSGPTFGGGNDIVIFNNANEALKSWSNLGYTYKHPCYVHGTSKADSFLAGSFRFQLSEIEVYQKL